MSGDESRRRPDENDTRRHQANDRDFSQDEGTTRRRALVVGIAAVLAALWYFLTGSDEPAAPSGGTPTPGNPDAPANVSVDDPWPTYQYDAANRGWVPDGTGPTAAVESRWKLPTNDTAYGCAVVEGTVFAGTESGFLVAVDGATGTEQWRFDADGAVRAVPAVHEGTVYVGTDAHTLYAIDAESGDSVWETTLPHRPKSATVQDGTVYVVAEASLTLHAIDAADGTERWRTTLADEAGGTESAPAVGEYVYVTDPFVGVHALDPADGSVAWEQPFETRIRSTPALADGRVYVAGGADSGEGIVAALDGATGETQWTTTTGSGVRHCPAVTDDAVYVSEQLGGQVHRLDRATGESDWEVARESQGRPGGASVVGGTLYVTASATRIDDSVWAFDPESGDQHWSFETGGSVLGPPAVASGLVFVGSALPDGGRVMALQEPQ